MSSGERTRQQLSSYPRRRCIEKLDQERGSSIPRKRDGGEGNFVFKFSAAHSALTALIDLYSTSLISLFPICSVFTSGYLFFVRAKSIELQLAHIDNTYSCLPLSWYPCPEFNEPTSLY